MADGSTIRRQVSVQTELARLAGRKGFLTPEQVVTAAANPASPLHDRFTWDDSKAAHQYRLWQARELIASVVFEPTPGRAPFRAYVNIRTAGEQEGRYVSTIDALSDPKIRRAIVSRALQELERVRERYEELNELSTVWRAIRKAAE